MGKAMRTTNPTDTADEKGLPVDSLAAGRMRAAIGAGFSKWHRWNDRENHPDAASRGIYLIGHIRRVPNRPADPTSARVVYIGQTGRWFAKRWAEFDRSAATGKRAHSGGRGYHGHYGNLQSDLCVAALPVRDLKGLEFSVLVALYESKLLCDYLLLHGSLPKCNTVTTRQ